MRLKSDVCRLIAALMSAAGIAACGGGGAGGGESASVRAPLPTLVQDEFPAGARINVSADDFFPFAAGDRAIYSAVTGVGEAIVVVREVLGAPDADGRVTVRESVPGRSTIETIVERWQPRTDGLYALDFLGDAAPAGFRALVGDLLYYPTPFFQAGTARRSVRQGDLGADLDGDGINESFRLEFVQEFVGFLSAMRGAGPSDRRASRTALRYWLNLRA